MKNVHSFFFRAIIATVFCFSFQITKAQNCAIDFYDGTFNFEANQSLVIDFKENLTQENVLTFYQKLTKGNYQNLVQSLLSYKAKYKLNDWLYYQLIRKTADYLSAKNENYNRYTLYKWFLLAKSGYNAKIAIGNNQLIFYVNNEEDISDIPFFMVDQKKYMCLNYHDYGKLFQKENTYVPVNIIIPEAQHPFSYKVTRMPDFKPDNYVEQTIEFHYKHKSYHFQVKLNKEVAHIFANYPGVDFETYFNIPLSHQTYQSLIPILKENIKSMTQKNGVDYLMRFTRYGFLYENDVDNFGKEKRLSPEQTLLTKYSDCDDRAALFFYLVKEIYNLPMVAVLYPTHVTMAVALDKPIGNAIIYNGKSYSICEPTPQKQNLKIGELAANLRNKPFEIVYHYEPVIN